MEPTTTPPPSTTPPPPAADPSQQLISPLTRLTILKGPSSTKSSQSDIRRSISFGFVSNSTLNSNLPCHQSSQRSQDRPRVITNRKSQTETENELLNSIDHPPASPSATSSHHPHHHHHHHHHHHSTPSPSSSNHPIDRSEPLNLKSIPSEVLLPFAQREVEVIDLLSHDRNIALFNRLRHTLGHPNPTWTEFESRTLRAPRSELDDRRWIQAIQSVIEPVDNNLWVGFCGLIGADGFDQAHPPSIEPDWMIQPVRVRRSSARSNESRRWILGSSSHHHRSSIDSFVSVFESDHETASVVSQSPRAVMESIKEQEGPELDGRADDSDGSPIIFPPCFDSADDLTDDSHPLSLKILDRSPACGLESPLDPQCTNLADHHPSHGLKYTFGDMPRPSLGS